MRRVTTVLLILLLPIFLSCASIERFQKGELVQLSLTDDYILDLIKNSPGPEEFPGVPAVYLLLDEKNIFNEDGTGRREMHVVCKMLTDQASILGEISIPFNSSNESVDIVLARTILILVEVVFFVPYVLM